jgi:hypothetical protein
MMSGGKKRLVETREGEEEGRREEGHHQRERNAVKVGRGGFVK